jgi:hypothetical protein
MLGMTARQPELYPFGAGLLDDAGYDPPVKSMATLSFL